MGKNNSWPVTSLWSRGPLKDLKDSKLILNESKLFPWSSRVSLVPFRTFTGPLFPKPVTGQELFFAVSYSKLALAWFLVKNKERNAAPSFHLICSDSMDTVIYIPTRNSETMSLNFHEFKFRIFWEGHTNLAHLPLMFWQN